MRYVSKDTKLGTTTWVKRNTASLKEAKNFAKNLNFKNPVLIDYGPGGTVNFLSSYLPKGNKNDWNSLDKLKRGVVKIVESGFRKTNLFSLKTSEPEEICYLFEDLKPVKMYVIDKEQKVINSVNQIKGRINLSTSIKGYLLNIQKNNFNKKGDVVFAYNIVERTKNPKKSLSNIIKSIKVGGLFSTSVRMKSSKFKQMGEYLYHRLN